MPTIFYSILSFLSGLLVAQILVETTSLPILVIALIGAGLIATLNYILTSHSRGNSYSILRG